jgi:hypothetical protein
MELIFWVSVPISANEGSEYKSTTSEQIAHLDWRKRCKKVPVMLSLILVPKYRWENGDKFPYKRGFVCLFF